MNRAEFNVAVRVNFERKEGESELAAYTRAFDAAMRQIGKSAQEVDVFHKLAADVEAGKVSLSELSAENVELLRIWREMSQEAADKDLLGLRAHQEIQEEIDATREAYARLQASGKLTEAELAQAALRTEERVRELEKSTNGWADAMFKAKASVAGAAGAFAGMVKVVGAAANFESAMAGVKKVVDGTDQQLAQLSENIKQLSTTLPLAATELAEIATAGGQLGVPIEKLETFVNLAAKMSTAFNMTAEEAGQAVAKLTNIFGLPIEQVEALGDAINTLGNTTAATESSIVEVLTRIGGTAKQFGLSAEQASALASTMLSMGVSAQVAGTGINAILNKLQTATIQGKDFQDALAAMGVSAQQLAADIQANPQAALTEFLRTLEQVDKASRAEILSRLFGAEYQDDVARLLGGLKQYEQALSRVGDAAQTAGAMGREFDAQLNTTENQLQLAKNALEAVATTIGESLLPYVRMGVGIFGGVAEALGGIVNLCPPLAGLVTVFATLAASQSVLRLAFAATKVAGVQAFTGIATAAGMSKLAIEGTTAAAGVLGRVLGTIGKMWLAFEVGMNIGEWAREQFQEVELAGMALVQGLQEIGVHLRSLFDWDDGAEERKKAALAEIRDTYGDMAVAAIRAREEGTKTATETGEALEQAGEAAKGAAVQIISSAQAANNLQSALKAAGEEGEDAGNKLREALNSFDLTDTGGIKALNDALDEVGEKAQAVREQLQAALDGMDTAQLAATAAQIDEAFAQGEISAERFAQMNEQVVAASLQKLGLTADEALGRVSGAAAESIENFGLLAKRIAGTADSPEAKMQALARAGEQLIGKLKTGAELDAFVARLHEMAANGEISAEAAARLKDKVEEQRASLQNAGGAAESYADKLRKAADAAREEAQALTQSSSAAVSLARAQLDLARAGGDANEIREASIRLAQAEAENAEAVAAAKQKEAEAALADADALAAELTAKGQLDAAAQTQIRNAYAVADAKQVEAAAARTAAAAAQAQAQTAGEAGEASAQAAKKSAEAAENASSAHLISWQSVARAGRITADELNQYADAIQGAWMRTKDLITSKSLYFDAQNVGQRITDEMKRAIAMAKAVDNAIASLQSGHATMRDLQQAAGIAQSAVGKVGDERLSALRSALQDAQNRMRELSATARDALSTVRDELDQLRGNTEALEKRRGEEKLRELQAQLAEARAQGNTQAVADLSEAIRLQQQLNAEKLKAAREEKAERNRDTRNTGSTGSASSSGGTQTVKTVNVRLGGQSARVIASDEAALLDMLARARSVS